MKMGWRMVEDGYSLMLMISWFRIADDNRCQSDGINLGVPASACVPLQPFPKMITYGSLVRTISCGSSRHHQKPGIFWQTQIGTASNIGHQNYNACEKFADICGLIDVEPYLDGGLLRESRSKNQDVIGRSPAYLVPSSTIKCRHGS